MTFNPINDSFLSISRHCKSESELFFCLDVPAGQDLDIRPGKSARLVMDASRPTLLGCRWDSDDSEGESTPARCESRISLLGRGEVRLTWELRTGFFYTTEAFLPIDKDHYGTEVQVDQEARTIWWPLPAGRSVNGLSSLLGFEEDTLYEFVQRWFRDKGDNCPLPFKLSDSTGESYDETSYLYACHTADEAAMDWVSIPDELLRDPIRNGSADPSDGYNPWNEEQKARIVSHLEQELARLVDLFRQYASSPKEDFAAVQ